jgi:hypothetical protein
MISYVSAELPEGKLKKSRIESLLGDYFSWRYTRFGTSVTVTWVRIA